MKNKNCLIEVTELRAIGSDLNQWTVLRRTKSRDKETGKPTGGYSDWGAYKYFAGDRERSGLQNAIRYLEGELLRTSGATTFPELRRMAKQIHDMMMETVAAAEDIGPRGKV